MRVEESTELSSQGRGKRDQLEKAMEGRGPN